MTSGPTTKVRLVRCPRCRKLLPELANFLVYKCGGCGTVLQAKKRNNEANTTISGLPDTDAAQTNELDHVSKDQESSSSSHEGILSFSGECCVDQNNGREQNGYEDCNGDKVAGINLSNEDHNQSDQNESAVCNVEQLGVGNEICSSSELGYQENEDPSLLAGAITDVEEDDESSPLAGAKAEEELNEQSDCNIINPSTENIVATRGSTFITAHRPLHEGISLDTHLYSPNEQLELPQKTVLRGYDRVESNDTFESTEYASPRSQFSGTLRYMSQSLSSRAYCDDSVSSYDGTEDQFTDLDRSSFKNAYEAANFGISGERPARDSMVKISHPASNLMRTEEDEFPSWVPFYQRGFQSSNEIGSPSNQGHDEFISNSNFHSPDKPEYPEQEERLKLLRMVYELQDQLNKSCDLKGKANERVPIGVPSDKMHMSRPYEENHYDLNCLGTLGRHGHEKNWPEQSKFSQRPYSAEATSSSHQVDYSCLHFHPPDWQGSAQLSPPHLCHNNGLCRTHPGHHSCNLYSSCPLSPQMYLDSEFPTRVRETKSQEQRQKDHEVKKYLRERHRVVRRHFRPIAGAAPFISCNNCLNLVQLPADFLLFKRKCHRLRCGACSEVLEFSLQDRTHIAPYTARCMDPPASEVDDYNNAINRRNFMSASQASDWPNADPVSYSDNYGLSFCKSSSTEGDHPLPRAPFNTTQGTAVDRKMSNGSSSKDMGQRPSNKYKNPAETYESDGSSSKMSTPDKLSSEIEEVPLISDSPLHRLMGYSSPSQVWKGNGSRLSGIGNGSRLSGIGTSNSHNAERNLRRRK